MELVPQDLGRKWHIGVVRYRALGNARFTIPPRVGPLGRLWMKGLDLSDDVAAATLPMMTDTTLPLVAGVGTGVVLSALAVSLLASFRPGVVIGAMLVMTVALFISIIFLPRQRFHRLHRKPVRWDELEALKGAQPVKQADSSGPTRRRNPLLKVMDGLRGNAPLQPGDELEAEFLRFVQDVLDLRGLSPTVEAEVRRVLQSLGDAIGELPDPMLENDDVRDIVREVTTLTEKARDESDTIVAESLLRQAEAHLTRANAVDNNRKLVRRTAVLRDELVAQVRAVRSLLPTLSDQSVSAAKDFGRLVSVAAAVQSIASEAKSVTQAREELSLELYPRLGPVSSPATNGQTVQVNRR